MDKLNWQDFDIKYKKLLKRKKGKDIACSRYDLEGINFKKRILFIINLLKKLTKEDHSCVYKVLYWEDDAVINKMLEKFEIPSPGYIPLFSYKNGIKPGEVFFRTESLSTSIISDLLLKHFNFELAKNPALNIRVQLCISLCDYDLLFDFYDDRGFDLYWIDTKTMG